MNPEQLTNIAANSPELIDTLRQDLRGFMQRQGASAACTFAYTGREN